MTSPIRVNDLNRTDDDRWPCCLSEDVEMIFGDIAPPAVAERARELVEVALPYTVLLATFAFIGAVAAGIVR